MPYIARINFKVECLLMYQHSRDQDEHNDCAQQSQKIWVKYDACPIYKED